MKEPALAHATQHFLWDFTSTHPLVFPWSRSSARPQVTFSILCSWPLWVYRQCLSLLFYLASVTVLRSTRQALCRLKLGLSNSFHMVKWNFEIWGHITEFKCSFVPPHQGNILSKGLVQPEMLVLVTWIKLIEVSHRLIFSVLFNCSVLITFKGGHFGLGFYKSDPRGNYHMCPYLPHVCEGRIHAREVNESEEWALEVMGICSLYTAMFSHQKRRITAAPCPHSMMALLDLQFSANLVSENILFCICLIVRSISSHPGNLNIRWWWEQESPVTFGKHLFSRRLITIYTKWDLPSRNQAFI